MRRVAIYLLMILVLFGIAVTLTIYTELSETVVMLLAAPIPITAAIFTDETLHGDREVSERLGFAALVGAVAGIGIVIGNLLNQQIF